MVIRRIGVLSLGKISGAVHGGLGLILGAVVSLISLFGAAFSQATGDQPGGQIVAAFFGIGAVIALPLFYGVIGFIFGLIAALIYNLVASIIGGLEIEVS